VGQRAVDTPFGSFNLCVFRDVVTHATHLALVKGKPTCAHETLVRVHEPLSVMDLIDPVARPHSWTVPNALEHIEEAGCGVLILLHRTESADDLLARALPTGEVEAVTWDNKTFGIGAQMLKMLGVGKMRLMSSARDLPSMAGFNLEVTGFCQPQHGALEID